MNELRLILIAFGILLLVAIYWAGRREEQRRFRHNLPKNPDFFLDDVLSDGEFSEIDLNDNHDEKHGHLLNPDDFSIKDLETHIKQQFHHEEQDSIYRIRQVETAPKISMAGLHVQDGSPVPGEPVLIPDTTPAQKVIEIPPGLTPMIVVTCVLASDGKLFDGAHLKDCLEKMGFELGDMNIYHYFQKTLTRTNTQSVHKLFSVANAIQPGRFDAADISSYNTSGVAFFMQLPAPIDGILGFEKMLQTADSLAKKLGGVLCDEKHNKLTSQTITHLKDQISDYNLHLQLSLKRMVH